MNLLILLFLLLPAGSAQTKHGRSTNYRVAHNSRQAAPAAKPLRREAPAPAEPAAPTPVPGALIRSAGLEGQYSRPASPQYTHFGDMGSTYGYKILPGGRPLYTHKGVQSSPPDLLPGQGGLKRNGGGDGTPSTHQSWVSEMNNTTVNGNSHNSNGPRR